MTKVFCTNCEKLKHKSKFFRSGGSYGNHCSKCRSYTNSLANWKQQKISITALEYKYLCEYQQYKCKICGDQYPNWTLKRSKRLAVDHVHGTNIIRGLLCTNCNVGLGMFKDKRENLEKAIEYLQSKGYTPGKIRV